MCQPCSRPVPTVWGSVVVSKVMGIDPGFRATGWALVDVGRDEVVGAGLVRTEKSARKVPTYSDDWRCLQESTRQLARVIEHYRPSALVVEAPVGSQSSRAALAMGYAFATLASLSQTTKTPVVIVQAGDAKKAVAGGRAASKEAVAAGVLARWPELMGMAFDAVGRAKTKVEHIYDSAALVVAAWDSDVVRMARRHS